MVAVDKIYDIAENSPHKIFIGGISEAFSSNMLMEIASAFGILRAYQFQFYKEINGSCAFLEGIRHKEHIQDAISWYNKFLGFRTEGGHGVKLIFNNINSQNPNEEYSFTLRHADDNYTH
ncbi:hypothetical protein GIB67_008034 [Kingdonia uniflora]|uniref:Kinetochore protein SPC25 n=1 Tax=Kingdonia uniflora TaxID=39325 RepID=A0A7J7MN77_9MAGN|nr:hypothetical protein GIB67_008034 [Kingdonia uniflora]